MDGGIDAASVEFFGRRLRNHGNWQMQSKNVLGAFRTIQIIQVQHDAVVKWIQMAAMHSDQ